MKIKFLIMFLFLFCSSFSVNAESIKSYESFLQISEAGKLNIVENIVWRFNTNTLKHGIVRNIPTTKSPGQAGKISIANFLAVDENDIPYPVSATYRGSEIEYKIGNPNQTVDGDKKYVLSYNVKNSLGYFSGYTEIYWNLIGTDWNVEIEKATAQIILPEGLDPQSAKVYCGMMGQKDECATLRIEKNTVYLEVKKEYLPLKPKYGVTVAIAFPRGYILSEPSATSIKLREIFYYMTYLFYLLPFIIAKVYMNRKIKRKKIWKKYVQTHPIVTQYDAGGYTPLQASLIYNEGSNYKLISSEILFLVTEDYIEVKRDENNIILFARTSKKEDNLLPHQKLLLANIADKNETVIKLTFFKTVKDVIDEMVHGLNKKNIFKDNSVLFNANFSKSLYYQSLSNSGALVIAIFLSINPGLILYFIFGWQVGYLWSASCIMIGLYGIVLGNKYNLDYTDEGLRAKWYISGLYTYIDLAEKDKIALDANPEKSLVIAEKLLPFAMIFGMEKKWIAFLNKMLDLSHLAETNITVYNYHSSLITSLANQRILVNSLYSSAMPTRQATSGGWSSGTSSGSSGSGGGGGGGGSW